MPQLVLIVGVMLATVLAVGAGSWLRLPYPVIMVLVTVVAAFIPGFPDAAIPADLILPLFLPPLLYAAAIKLSWSVIRARWRSVILLAVALILVTIAAVAGVTWLLIPSIGLPAAVALGAVVAPPDPVSVDAVAGSVSLPRRLLSMLQTEGLFNDATSIVVFQAAIGATVAGQGFTAAVGLEFLFAAAISLIIGFVAGWITKQIFRFVNSAAAGSATTLVIPFAVYILADELHGSGVIAVVVTALEIRRHAKPQEADERITSRAFWEVLQLLATGLAFALIGLVVRQVIVNTGEDLWRMLGPAAAICGVVVGVRALWMIALALGNRLRPNHPPPANATDVTLLTWCGMRGIVTLALALALPGTLADGSPFPARGEIIIIACAVLVVTLVLPGLTLRMLVKLLDAAESPTARQDEAAAIGQRAEDAAMAALTSAAAASKLTEEQTEGIRRELSGMSEKLSARSPVAKDTADFDEREAVLAAHAIALDAARREVLQMRGELGIDPDVADGVLRRLDLRTMLLDDARQTSGPPPE